MPHAGLIEEKELGPVAGPFQRSRLHLRAGRRRLRQGKISAGIATLFDAVVAAMEAYAAVPGRKQELCVKPGENMNDDKVLFRTLVRSGKLDGSFDFDAFDRLMEKALYEDLRNLDYRPLLRGIESVLTQLGILPFDESLLPPEDPNTF